jgi:hypothetical protein
MDLTYTACFIQFEALLCLLTDDKADVFKITIRRLTMLSIFHMYFEHQ